MRGTAEGEDKSYVVASSCVLMSAGAASCPGCIEEGRGKGSEAKRIGRRGWPEGSE